jgi:hypothetical protein
MKKKSFFLLIAVFAARFWYGWVAQRYKLLIP